MKPPLLANECCEAELVAALRRKGFDVDWIAETHRGAPDAVVLSIAAGAGRVLITADKDFGELAVNSGKASAGVCLMRLTTLTVPEKIARVLTLLDEHGSKLAGSFCVVERGRYRFRSLAGRQED